MSNDPAISLIQEIVQLGKSIRQAERNQERRKARRDALISAAIAQGIPKRKIARALGISHVTVISIAKGGDNG